MVDWRLIRRSPPCTRIDICNICSQLLPSRVHWGRNKLSRRKIDIFSILFFFYTNILLFFLALSRWCEDLNSWNNGYIIWSNRRQPWRQRPSSSYSSFKWDGNFLVIVHFFLIPPLYGNNQLLWTKQNTLIFSERFSTSFILLETNVHRRKGMRLQKKKTKSMMLVLLIVSWRAVISSLPFIITIITMNCIV